MRAKENVDALAGDPGFQSVLAAWHPRLGHALIGAWALSPELAAAVGEHESCTLAAADPPTMTAVVAAANYLAEHSEAAFADADFHAKAPDFGALSLDKPTFDWIIRAADVDVRLLMIAFGL
jgi:hypothetical protein